MGGFPYSTAWTLSDTTGTMLVQRHVTGSSALPLFVETAFTDGDSLLVTGASMPGTAFFPGGSNQSFAWSLLPSGGARFLRTGVDPAAVDSIYDRIVLPDGDELLFRTAHSGSELVFDVPRPRPAVGADTSRALVADSLARAELVVDSSWVLAWPGLLPGTDLGAWRSVLRGEEPSFALLETSGLLLGRDGGSRVVGSPAVQTTHGRGVLVSNNEWSAYAAARLDSIAAETSAGTAEPPFLDDCQSTWAAALEPRFVAAIDTTFSHRRFVEEALTYLRNWNYSYRGISIGASIFDMWMTVHRDSTGSLPTPALVDTSDIARRQLYTSLAHALMRLADRFGTDMSAWRWEAMAPATFHFPVWSADSLRALPHKGLASTRYAPIELPGRGHPTTLCWGPSPILPGRPHPAHWESWVSTSEWDAFQIRRRRLDTDAVLARYRIQEHPPEPVRVGTDIQPRSRTELTP